VTMTTPIEKVSLEPHRYRIFSTTQQDDTTLYHYLSDRGLWFHLDEHGQRYWYSERAKRWLLEVGTIGTALDEYRARRRA
jgi:hypothetical protein